MLRQANTMICTKVSSPTTSHSSSSCSSATSKYLWQLTTARDDAIRRMSNINAKTENKV